MYRLNGIVKKQLDANTLEFHCISRGFVRRRVWLSAHAKCKVTCDCGLIRTRSAFNFLPVPVSAGHLDTRRQNAQCIDKEGLFHFLHSFLCGYKSFYRLTSCSITHDALHPYICSSKRLLQKRIYNIYSYLYLYIYNIQVFLYAFGCVGNG